DAAVVLGFIDPDYFLGGRMRLDRAAAEDVVGKLGLQLSQPVKKTAQAILTIASEHMVQAIQAITINEGLDPRESLIVAGGGAAGLNIVPIARELGCRRIVIPRTAAALSACGGLVSDIVADFSVSKFADTRDFSYGLVNESLRAVEEQMQDFASGLAR